MEVTTALAETVAALAGHPLSRSDLEAAIASGRARERFDAWAAAQGADPAWLAAPRFELAPVEQVIEAPRGGRLAAVDTRQLGLLLIDAGGGRATHGAEIDHGVALRTRARIGDAVAAGDELARLHLRRDQPELVAAFSRCYRIEDRAHPPELIVGRVG